MRNIDKVKEMTSEELVTFMKKDKCERCTYNDTNCHHDMCTEGMKLWLEEEAQLTVKDISNEFKLYCDGERNDCIGCYYNINGHRKNGACRIGYIATNFNIIDGKITRR